MTELKLTEDCLSLIEQFGRQTGVVSRDCIIDDRNGRLIFVVDHGNMGLVIGKNGSTIKKASEQMQKRIEVVEYNEDAETFIKNCFLPAKVTSITFEGEGDQQIVKVEVTDSERGIAIGKDGKNILKAKRLAQRHHNILDVQILPTPSHSDHSEESYFSSE